jgi:hypothetical protein
MSSIIASRKIVWPAAALLVGMYFFPSILNFVHRATASAPQPVISHAPPATPKPTAAVVATIPAVATPSPSAAFDEAAALQSLAGTWQGESLVEKRGLCNIRFELKPAANPGEFSGYSTLVCAYTPLLPGLEKPKTMSGVADFMRPVSSILSGIPAAGGLQFHVEKTLGDKCPPTSFTLTPFSAQLAAEWQDAACGGGHIIMARTK